MKNQDRNREIEWHTIIVLEALVNGYMYRIEEARSNSGYVNIFCDGKCIGCAENLEAAKDAICKGSI